MRLSANRKRGFHSKNAGEADEAATVTLLRGQPQQRGRYSEKERNVELHRVLPCQRSCKAETFQHKRTGIDLDTFCQEVIGRCSQVVERRALLPEPSQRCENF